VSLAQKLGEVPVDATFLSCVSSDPRLEVFGFDVLLLALGERLADRTDTP